MVRMPTRSILGCSIEPSVFSISVQATPRQPSSPASASPTGPPPTISTGTRALICSCAPAPGSLRYRRAAGVRRTARAAIGIADAPVLLQVRQRALHAEERGLQCGIGVEHAGKAEPFESLVGQFRRLAAEHDVDDLRPGQLSDRRDLLRRLSAPRRSLRRRRHRDTLRRGHRRVESLGRDGVGARDNDQVGIAAGVDGGLTLATISACGIISLPSKWPQRFGKHLVLDLDRVGAGALQHRMVRRMLSALPKPVSASTISGP